MLLLNQNNKTPLRVGMASVCCITGEQFTVKPDGCSFNFARDNDGRIYSDRGVYVATRRDIKARKTIGLYITHATHGSAVTGWKGEKHGRVISVVDWTRYSNLHGAYKMYSVKVRMFDGSLWQGRMSSLGQSINLKHKGS